MRSVFNRGARVDVRQCAVNPALTGAFHQGENENIGHAGQRR
jgi:hypothetical protein